MSKLRAVIFDVDGVLVDSREANAEFYLLLLEKAGYKRPSRRAVDQCFHLPMWQAIERLTGSHETVEIQRLWDMGHGKSIYPDHLLIFPDSIESILADLDRHYQLAIVTGRIKEGVQTIYSARDIKRYFDIVVTYEDYTNPKPHPEPLQIALKKLDIQPDEAVYIGDSHVDVESAAAAGIWSIHLAPEKHGDATIGITDFNDVLPAVQEVAQRARSGFGIS